jgi:LuxR family transcriptional regulator, maltose regulon positive regulatory protein
VDGLRTGSTRVARPALARRLSDALVAGHVLVVAGAGYGKSMALEEAIQFAERRAVWLSGQASGGKAGRLLIAAVEGLRAAVPGLADVAGDRLAAGLEPVDVGTATGALLADVEKLLVEPLIVVVDDAEELEGDREALALLEQLLRVHGVPLSVAIASRRPLPLKLAKLRARGRLVELGPAELSLTASECEELLRLRHGRAVGDEEVEAVLRASEGWPMGVALTGLTGSSSAASSTVPRAELFEYLAEEVLERLDADTRRALLDSSVPSMLTPEVTDALGLPPGFLDAAEDLGLFLRTHPSGERSYHPLFRAFLLERLEAVRPAEERAALHARAAESLAASGRAGDAIEHWIAAGRYEEALAALVTAGGELIRVTPGRVREWLCELPAELRREPDYLLLEGQLEWGAGDYERALERLRGAVSGYEAKGDADRAWLARVLLADTHILLGDFAVMVGLADGWEEVSSPIAGAAATAVAWYAVAALASLGRAEEAEALRTVLTRDPDAAALFTFLDAITRAGAELAAGPAEPALARMRSAVDALEQSDPFGRMPYALGGVLVILRDLGHREAALALLDRCEQESERLGQVFGAGDFRAQRASLLARAGDLPTAEVFLAQSARHRGVWRGLFHAEAEADVAIARGDGAAAAEAAQRALGCAASAPPPWQVRCTVEMATLLAQAGAPALARAAIDATLGVVDERFPAARGSHHRAWLLAARACVEHQAGDLGASCETLRCAWAEAGEEAGLLVRARWPAIQPVLWHALADDAIDSRAVLPALEEAVPGGDALVAMVDHPSPAVRRAALSAALAANHPAVLDRLAALEKDDDAQVAAAAAATGERLRMQPPPLRFELLGGFRVKRAGWPLDEAAWQRPMAARVVRFLLVQGGGAVPEDELFEAFWADRPADAARQHLTVAISRARKVLDLPGAERSTIEARERTYRLCLDERDSVDADEFERAAADALADRGPERRAALARVAALWSGEPLPEDRYAVWSQEWRERLVRTNVQVLGALAAVCAGSGDHHEAIRAAQALLSADPLNEEAHRQLIVSYARSGRTSHALRQYLECRRGLVTELGVEPAAETSALQARILAGAPV